MHQIDINVAKTTAKHCYEGKEMPDGSSMMDHCVRISNVFGRMTYPEVAMVGLLHEVVKSKLLTEKDLINLCVHKPVIQAVVFYAQREDETYIDYMVRLSQDPVAASVAAVDIAEHLLMEPTELEYKQYQYGLLILSGWAPRGVMVDPVYDHLEVPKNMRGFGPEYQGE